jgi:hypothetical protein
MDLEQMRELGQQLTNHHQEVSRCPHHELASRLVTAEMEIQGLKDEIEELKEEVQERTTYAVLPAEGQFMEENEKLKEELSATNTALEMLKDENEVNKKNMLKFMEENKKLKEAYEEQHKYSCELGDYIDRLKCLETVSEDEEEESEEMKKLLKENEDLKKKILAQ